MAEITVFVVNNNPNYLTVNETDPVTLQCTAVGRPTPAMRIVKNGQRVADRPRGQVSPEDTATLEHRVSRAECSEAGLYGCQLLDNDNPAGHEEDVTLLVNCESVFSGPLVLSLSLSACLAQSNFMQTATCLLHLVDMVMAGRREGCSWEGVEGREMRR